MRRRRAMFAGIGIGAYLLALVWAIPASLMLSTGAGIAAVDGTVWRGRAILAGGETLDWRWAPLRSLVNLGFAADWTVAGAGTDLAGRLLLHPGRVVIDKASGSATGSLLAAAMPGLTFVCGMPLQVAIDRAAVGGGAQALAGEIRSGAGLCAPKSGGAATSVPAMIVGLSRVGNGSAILLAPLGQRRRTLADGTLERSGALHLRVTPEGARALPFLSPPGGMAIDTTL